MKFQEKLQSKSQNNDNPIKNLDCKNMLIFQSKNMKFQWKQIQEKVQISRNSLDFKHKLRFQMLGWITLCELLFIIRVREAFRVTPAVTKVDSLLRVASFNHFE